MDSKLMNKKDQSSRTTTTNSSHTNQQQLECQPKIYKFCPKTKKIVCKNMEKIPNPQDLEQVLSRHGPMSLLTLEKFSVLYYNCFAPDYEL